jgi:endonuclease/exonuclease/phosphatase family metal-dependent hydrolase
MAIVHQLPFFASRALDLNQWPMLASPLGGMKSRKLQDMRIATFNLESLDLSPKARVPLEVRSKILRPALQRLQADVLCLQEVNGQHIPGQRGRRLLALDRLLAGTAYANYARVATSGAAGRDLADVHNLVTLSRFPIRAHQEVRHRLFTPPSYQLKTAFPPQTEPRPIGFDRPILVTHIEPPGGDALVVINVHLRAPLAVAVPGQKLEPFVWKTVAGWAEGYFLSAMRRAGQSLEVRLLLEELFDADASRLIAIAGDFNAEDHEVPLSLIVGAEESTGNPLLAQRSLVVLDRAVPADRRWSVLHHGRREMLDHVLSSQALHGCFRFIEIHNEALSDELLGYARHMSASASTHAPIVADFDIGKA